MSKALRISVLIFALTCSVSAGEIPNNVTGTPQPTPAPAAQGPTADGEIDTGATAPTADGIMGNDAAITFAQVLLSLLALS